MGFRSMFETLLVVHDHKVPWDCAHRLILALLTTNSSLVAQYLGYLIHGISRGERADHVSISGDGMSFAQLRAYKKLLSKMTSAGVIRYKYEP